jgi:FAD/FMN-containing dehydrogenase
MSLSTLTLPDGISFIPITEWENRHQNFRVTFAKDACFNMRLPFPFDEHAKNYQATTKNFQWLIRYAIERGLRLRAMGGGWSFTDVAVGDGIVDTRELRDFYNINESFLSAQYLANGGKAVTLFSHNAV